MRPIAEVAAELGLEPDQLIPRGRFIAKVPSDAGASQPRRGKLVLVSAITPTPAGEGKTATTVGLSMGLRRRGVKAAACLREPSLGPLFGRKGGASGGGKATVEPASDINLHFTGDMHAVTAAHNLLAALVDNDLHFGGASGLTSDTVRWPRVLDVNDRALRRVSVSVADRKSGPRQSRFDITPASEVMASLCLARDLPDLRERLGRLVVGSSSDGSTVTAADVGAVGAMMVLLRDAMMPNLVQTAEGGPAFVHGGPFANIAHGCSSVAATELALRSADVVLTEAGFGFDLGGEKFLHLKCRSAGLWPSAVVLVVTLRALAAHGSGEGTAAIRSGLANFDQIVSAVGEFGLKPIVALNVFDTDSESDLRLVLDYAAERGLAAAPVRSFALGGEGAEPLADALMDTLAQNPSVEPRFLYAQDAPLVDKLEAIATRLYGADGVDLTPKAEASLQRLTAAGFGSLPPCIAKTHLSLSGDAKAKGAPRGFRLDVRDLRLSAGAGFVVALAGRVFTMPGLPKEPSVSRFDVGPDGAYVGFDSA